MIHVREAGHKKAWYTLEEALQNVQETIDQPEPTSAQIEAEAYGGKSLF